MISGCDVSMTADLAGTVPVRSSLVQSTNYKYWAFGAVAIGLFASVVDHGSVNLALPTIADHFHTDIPSVQWVIIGYALTISALLLPMGKLADMVGYKRVFIIGSLVLIIGATLAGSATNLPMLILFRVLQGVGGAMTQGTGMAIVVSTFPASERGKAIGLIMTVVGTGAVAGPAVGGILVSTLGWRSVFFLNVPLVLLGIAACLAILQGGRGPQAGLGLRFDWLGASLSAAALVVFLLAISNGHSTGWDSPVILAGAAGVLALMGSFIWWELHTSDPMLDLRLFQRRTFTFGSSAAFLAFLGSSGVLFLMPFYLQGVLGYSPLKAGLVVVPAALCMAVLGPVSGRLSDRYGWRPFTVGGLALSVTGLFILSRVTVDSSLALVLPALVLHNSGSGVFYSPNSSSILSAVGQDQYAVVSGFLNLIRNAANVTSVAGATAVVSITMVSMGFEPSLDLVRSGVAGEAFTSGLRYTFLGMMGVLTLAMVVSAFKFQQVQRATTPAAA